MGEFLHHYREILTDPAHLAVELTLMLLVDILFLGMVMPLIMRRIRREHHMIDAEHGYPSHSRHGGKHKRARSATFPKGPM